MLGPQKREWPWSSARHWVGGDRTGAGRIAIWLYGAPTSLGGSVLSNSSSCYPPPPQQGLPPLFQAPPEEWSLGRQPSEGTWGLRHMGYWHSVDGAGALQPVGRQDLKPSHPRQRSSSWAGSSVSWKPVAVGGREDVRGLSLGSHPLPMSTSSHLSFGHFFDGFDPLRGLVSHIIFRGLCSGICLVRARP